MIGLRPIRSGKKPKGRSRKETDILDGFAHLCVQARDAEGWRRCLPATVRGPAGAGRVGAGEAPPPYSAAGPGREGRPWRGTTLGGFVSAPRRRRGGHRPGACARRSSPFPSWPRDRGRCRPGRGQRADGDGRGVHRPWFIAPIAALRRRPSTRPRDVHPMGARGSSASSPGGISAEPMGGRPRAGYRSGATLAHPPTRRVGRWRRGRTRRPERSGRRIGVCPLAFAPLRNSPCPLA